MKEQVTAIQITSDGSHTLHSSNFNASYHSIHGAIQESQVVFIDAALNYQIQKNKKELSILEIGLGTGLNALLTYLVAQKQSISIYYEGWEAYLVNKELLQALNYPTELGIDQELFFQFHQSPNQQTELGTTKSFQYLLKEDEFSNIKAQNQFDIIYHDAFAPSVQAELWETTFLQKLYDALKVGGVLSTYCAKGIFKRQLKAIGFEVEALPGPKGKREITRALKK